MLLVVAIGKPIKPFGYWSVRIALGIFPPNTKRSKRGKTDNRGGYLGVEKEKSPMGLSQNLDYLALELSLSTQPAQRLSEVMCYGLEVLPPLMA